MVKQAKQMLQLNCNAAQLVEACKDDKTYLVFHTQMKDKDIQMQPWHQNTAESQSRATSWTSPISSMSSQLATGVSSHGVRETTTISQLPGPEGHFRILTEAQCGGSEMFNRLSFSCAIDLRSQQGKAVQADAVLSAEVTLSL